MSNLDHSPEDRAPGEAVYHAPAYTAQRRVHYLRLPGRQVAKTVLLSGPGGPFLAVLPATHRIDLERMTRHLGGPVRLGTEREIADRFLDCEWGVVPSFGGRYGLPVVLDEGLAREEWVAFETSARAVAVRMRCRDFERLERPRRLPFARRAEAR